MFGGKRVGLFGNEDVEHKLVSFESKSTTAFVGKKWMEQAVRNNPHPETKIPVVAVQLKHVPTEKGFVVLRMEDFKKLLTIYEHHWGD